MGGQVYETLAMQLLKQGHAEGKLEGIFLSIDRLINSGQYTIQEACNLLGTEPSVYLVYKEQHSVAPTAE